MFELISVVPDVFADISPTLLLPYTVAFVSHILFIVALPDVYPNNPTFDCILVPFAFVIFGMFRFVISF